MSPDETTAGGGLYARLPFRVQLGIALLSSVYLVAVLTDIIEDPIPSDVWAVLWFAVAVGLLVRAVHLNRRS
ncbi:hypothetical protein FEJ81_09365 [Natrinema versiforme]|uniref:Uncharacterized protein n=1 Tax=Natrinema versiforme TaxID=88724 RepID=A0A4P8WGR1_9EURY|nr:hypothetical protein FEJ81_09365 [Natrinema versiforme]